jgi:hypothetical protein
MDASMGDFVVQFVGWHEAQRALLKKCRDGVATPPGSLDADLRQPKRPMLAKSNIGKKPGFQAD